MTLAKKLKTRLMDAGVTIKDAPEGSTFRMMGEWNHENQTDVLELWGDNATELAHAMLAARMMVLEHKVAFEQDPETGAVTVTVGVKNPRVVGEIEQIGDLPSAMPDVLGALTDGEADEVEEADAAEAEEEDLKTGSVVPDRYKERYKEQGHPGTCGDWLAATLQPLTTNSVGKLDPDAMEEIARLNGLSLDKLNRTTPGWQGRFRMTARNMLVKVVAKNGKLLAPNVEGDPTEHVAPNDWLAANQPKVKEPGDKAAARKSKGA